ncbi:MAG TPA: hypothetical protein VJL89_13925 [Thermodesulfovibrionia bacterium]|nr:hypothetical protein [Thermodesulfovibrionia bacterium]
MGLLETIEKTEFLGSEFLTWLWYMSEKHTGMFEIQDIGSVEVWFYDNVKLEKGKDGGNRESIICKGATSDLKEARLGLRTGKRLKEARLKIIIDDDEWFLTIDSGFLDFRQLKTPKIDKSDFAGDDKDADAAFYEKVYLFERAVNVIDNLFMAFIQERLSNGWHQTAVPAIRQWIQEGI